MNTVAKKLQMIGLQEEQCKIERESFKLDKKTVKNRTTEEKWDERCKQAVKLFNQGTEYPAIAQKVGCNVSSLYRELKKRGVLQMPRQVAVSKSVKSPIIPPQTKKSKFERYKEYYMYR
ncbi:hypothetical protein COF80_28905 [Bacillus toyonensis]|uniref:hypothetical protein n=1 Tax=Bacillus toyonensis TaxID=155322 RepID=UPI000BF198FB|nr:hypothetical protein [Bacillus toyonensis]PEM40469.1 hypothetical protein CN636_23855 [Bacillus toyonensis]PHE82196.1 hypothetical protein COF80_28905 [Bacillus toyonensis]